MAKRERVLRADRDGEAKMRVVLSCDGAGSSGAAVRAPPPRSEVFVPQIDLFERQGPPGPPDVRGDGAKNALGGYAQPSIPVAVCGGMARYHSDLLARLERSGHRCLQDRRGERNGSRDYRSARSPGERMIPPRAADRDTARVKRPRGPVLSMLLEPIAGVQPDFRMV